MEFRKFFEGEQWWEVTPGNSVLAEHAEKYFGSLSMSPGGNGFPVYVYGSKKKVQEFVYEMNGTFDSKIKEKGKFAFNACEHLLPPFPTGAELKKRFQDNLN